MSLESTGGTELRRCVLRWVDADLLLAGDVEALLNAAGDCPSASPELQHLLLQVETLVAGGDLSAAEAAPALCALRDALGG